MLNNLETIKCPIHKNIYIENEFFQKIIDTREFQRLRRISQIGCVTQIYPSANHTRLAHSLGVYEIARQLIRVYAPNNLSENEKQIILTASLLHDIGHGPLSHSFEMLFNTSHEKMTINIITSPETEINKILLSKGKKFLEEVVSVIKKRHPKKIMNLLLSSNVDVDRMDYLLRDSYHAGTNYGKYDLSWLLRCIIFKNDEIYFAEKGIPAIENYLLCRYFSYKQIYLHPKSIAYEVHLKSIITRMKDLKANNYIFKTDLNLFFEILESKQIPIALYLKIDDFWFQNIIQNLEQEEDEILKDLVYRINHHNIFLPTINPTEKMKNNILKKLKKDNKDPKYYLPMNKTKIKIYDNISKKIPNFSLKILGDNGKSYNLENKSYFFNILLNKVYGEEIIFSIFEGNND